jgi:hypothetical protein
MNEWAKEFLANTSDIDWTELDDDTSFLSSSPQNSSGIPAGKAEAIGSSSSTANTGDEQQPHKGKRRNHQKYRQRHQQQHRHNPCSDVNNDLPAIATAEHSGKEVTRESLRSRSPLRPARNRLFDGAVQSIVRDQQKRPSANDQSPTPTVAVSKPAYNHRQEADNLRQTIVSFQAPTMRRLDEVIDIIHQHCGVTQEFIMWRRLVPAFDKRLPIVVVRYCQKELAKLIRYACSEFIKQTECRDL